MENSPSRSWYLDPIVARQKQRAHLEWVARWTSEYTRERAGHWLKTDVFEEANGDDQLLFDLRRKCRLAIGFDHDVETVARACSRCPEGPAIGFLAADVRMVPLRTGSIDVIASSSTLDHFTKSGDFTAAIRELARVLRPGGLLIVTLDNPLNPLYWPLRWSSGAGPFRLGYTPRPRTLRRELESAGLDLIGSTGLIHNPRGISTLLFLGLRRVLGDRADPAIRGLLRFFAWFERLPTRSFTSCFYAVAARKREAPQKE